MDRRTHIGRQDDATTNNKSSGVEPDATGSHNCYPIDPHVLPKASAKHLTARYAFESGMHVVIEGLLYDEIYGSMLCTLLADHQGKSLCYRYDRSFDETLRRHASKEVADRFDADEMRRWWRDKDTLLGIVESPIPASQSRNDAVQRIVIDCGW